ncbi:MAG: BglG family transcription antiterminator [Clostridium sp.]|uniref:BglG family transcription antiterminator n=1 Tax=Clostridium sp. TaxID=1506 RepID=UPI0025BA2CEF|nr:BglG family transcription antiterminator [Clostridium sp.]MCH3965949.1 BglG family transcription antiterminator [Clostridium sp.]MCI1715962.1 BglG family transcription antiterminator [Clostridium sp.]MCI1800366.1 BglG family transcription antiterminator [Clostridium sp.]MCI1814139.1 BglG family transcription antiterminator [Clostridium sp.]MCI1871038.1 BglG family transcription antiterminator [Clostridium sp.]
MVNIQNKRLVKILKLLLNSKSFLTGEEISGLTGVSSRTIRTDIKNLNHLLKENGGIINSDKSKGYSLEIKDKKAFNKFVINEKEVNYLLEVKVSAPEERISYIMTKLLFNALNDEQITQMDLADEMFISLSTLKNDLKKVENKLAKYDLKIISYKTKGMMVYGNESQIRYCISEYIFNNTEDYKIEDNKFYRDIFKEIDLNKIRKVMLKIISKYSIKLTDAAFKNMLIHIAIMIERSNNKNLIVYTIDQMSVIEKTKEYRIVNELMKEIYKELNMDMIETEVYYITQHLIASKKYSEIDHNETDEEYKHIIKLIINKVDEVTNIDFNNDKQLIDGLKIHLKTAINRMKFGMNIRNEMLEVIKNNYQLAFQIAVIASKVIEEKEKIAINENEIGFIAIHFGAALSRKGINNEINFKTAIIVCSTGIGTAILIREKIKEYFKNKIKVVRTISLYEMDKKIVDNVDMILTTIPIKNIKSEKIIEVSNLLNANEVKKIENLIMGKEGSNELKYEAFFRKDCFYKEKSLKTKEEVIQFLTNEMIRKGFMTEVTKDSVIERENMSSTELGHLVAVPHPIVNDMNVSSIAILVLDKAIMWDEHHVQVVFLISISKDKFKLWETIFVKLFKYLVEEGGVKELIKHSDYDKFMNSFIG